MIDIDFYPNLVVLIGQVEKFGADIRSFRVPLDRAVREVMIPSFKANFDAGGRPPWDPLDEDTIKRKKDQGSILVKTGKLKQVAGQINLWTVTSEDATIGSLPEMVFYGNIQQSGASFKQTGVIPARPFIMAQEEDVDDVERIFEEWLGERIRMAGLH